LQNANFRERVSSIFHFLICNDISVGVGRGRDPPPPRSEKSFYLRGQGPTQPRLPAHSVLAPGPKQKRSLHFFKTQKRYEKRSGVKATGSRVIFSLWKGFLSACSAVSAVRVLFAFLLGFQERGFQMLVEVAQTGGHLFQHLQDDFRVVPEEGFEGLGIDH